VITLLTTLSIDNQLVTEVREKGLLSACFNTSDIDASIAGANVLLLNWPHILSESFVVRQKNVLNVHNSLLPRYRGRHAFSWAISNGEKVLGYSLHKVTSKVDAGEILAQTSFALHSSEDINDAICVGGRVLRKWLPKILLDWVNGELTPRIQDEAQATYFPRRHLHDNWIEAFDDANTVMNLVRAVSPPYAKGAFCKTVTGETLNISSCRVIDRAKNEFMPGSIICNDGRAIVVACRKGVVSLVPVSSILLRFLRPGDLLLGKVDAQLN